MLTLKQLLESDSLATIVAKLNQNFQVLSNSNGGPQGIRGSQGIPGLPGKMGPIGSTGAAGPTGTILGVIPFAKDNVSTVGVGPSVITTTEYGIVGPWPSSSYDWLGNYQSTASAGEIFIDHRNNGYWKYLTAPDVDGAAFPGYLSGNPYQYPAGNDGLGNPYVYPNLGPGSSPTVGGYPGFYAGAGWYFYPGQDASASGLGTVWVEDYTTYLQSALQSGTGPYWRGPFDGDTTNPLKIPNARLVSKYGTVWITSGNDATDNNSDGDLRTSNIGKWGLGPGSSDAQPGRYNAGVDRLLFKMSIDGLSYQSNITARGYTGPATMASPNPTPSEMVESTTYPIDKGGISFPSISTRFWAKPQYEVTLDQYSPILFLSHRNEINSATQGTYGTLGIYLYTDILSSVPVEYEQPNDPYDNGTLTDNNISKTIHLFTSRYSPDPMVEWDNINQPLNSAATLNYGEMVLDFRRVIASNQYVCSLPTDMKLSSDYRTSSSVYNENPLNGSNQPINPNRYKTFQGYISSINGKSLSGDAESPYYLEYGLGSAAPSGTAGTHDLSSGTAGMLTRRTWYGTSALDKKEFNGVEPGTNDYVRIAGMLERGRRVQPTMGPGGFPEASKSYFLSELIFYTSQFGLTGITGQQIDIDNVNLANNHHNSLPSLYISPFRNIGIGTFVGATGGVDGGPLEPMAKFHVHVKPMDRANDPTYDYKVLANGAGLYNHLPTNVFAAAAFSGQLNNPNDRRAVTDILLGNVLPTLNENIDPSGNVVNQLAPGFNSFKNAIRTESWLNAEVSTMHLGATPVSTSNSSIGRNTVADYRKEFQISLAPLNPSTNISTALRANTGVGIHNMFPRARFHMFGKNLYNETEFGLEPWTPSGVSINPTFGGLSGSYPFYGTTGTNAPSANQVVIDYIGSSYNYPVGIYEYQYWTFPGNTGTLGITSPNSVVYPNREQLGITRWINSYTTAESANFAFPSLNQAVNYLGSYKHGGTANAFWDPQTYIGFNLFRDLSAASNLNTKGDDRDDARWMLGTQGATANGHGNNGGAAIISSSQGELGIITIPRGRDGGRAYEQWEQRGLGTRDVLNQMKIVFDKNGNIAIGNAAGWDLDAYPSLNWNMTTGYVNYLPTANATTVGPLNANQAGVSTNSKYGQIQYSGYVEGSTVNVSSASIINARATSPEYIRLEVGAEKAWSRDGRMLQRLGWGYPPNRTIVLTGATMLRYVKTNFSGLPYTVSTVNSWTLTTDYEGRIVNNVLNVSFDAGVGTIDWSADPITKNNVDVVVFPHPSEFNTGALLNTLIGFVPFSAPAGAIAAEWWGMDNDSPTQNNATLRATTVPQIAPGVVFLTGANLEFIPTTDLRGSANVRLNNFVYGEGFGISGGTQGGGENRTFLEGDFTKYIVQRKRQESPKLILSFLEKTPTTARDIAGTTPYLKVNTVIQSAQNEASLREYWIPKADNTGGTFMVFTDFLGQKEKDTGFNQTPINNTGLFVEEVVTQEFLAGYSTAFNISGVDTPFITTRTSIANVTTATNGLAKLDYDVPLYNFYNNKPDGDLYKYAAVTPLNMYPGYVRYFNKAYNKPTAPAYFTDAQYGQIVQTNSLGPLTNNIIRTQADAIKHYTTFNIYPTPQTGNPDLSPSTCTLTNEDDEMILRFGYRTAGGGDGSTLICSEQYPRNPTSNRCSDFNMFITEDSVKSPGGQQGTIATKYNVGENINFMAFRRETPIEFPENPMGVKITITLEAHTFYNNIGGSTNANYDFFSHMGLRFLYGEYTQSAFNDGTVSNHRGTTVTTNAPLGVNAPNDKVIATFPLVQTKRDIGASPLTQQTGYSVNGTDTIYMSWDQWIKGQDDVNKNYWVLCACFMATNRDQGNQWYVPNQVATSSQDEGTMICPKFEIKFEYVWPEGGQGISERNTTVVTQPASSIRRNIDKYYTIYKPTISTQPEFGNIAGDNQATQIRVKRINSEYALVDYNITVQVGNPSLSENFPGDPASYIDFCSPRFTQYLRFLYIPDASGSAGLSKRLYDDDLSLINWSTYKNWLPGTAIVGDDMFGSYASPGSPVAIATTYNGGGQNIRTMTNDWSPFYNDQRTQGNSSESDYFTSPMTWNGNILETVAYAGYVIPNQPRYFVEEAIGKGNTRFSTLTRPLRSFYNVSGLTSSGDESPGFTANGSSEDYARNTAYAAFGSDTRILANAYFLFPYTRLSNGVQNARSGASADPDAAKQLAFVGYLGSMYALWKNEAFLRNKNTQWRILPAQPYLTGDTTPNLSTTPNRSFYLEVQLSTPILHCDIPFGSEFYGQSNLNSSVTPYRFLTLNGQAIVKFAETETFNRPYAIIGDIQNSGGQPTPPTPPTPPGPAGGEEDPFDGGFGPAGGGAFEPNDNGTNQNQEPGPGGQF
jgi:hypothetical protein